MGRYNVVMHTDSGFLQVFICDRFPLVAPKPTEFFSMVRGGEISKRLEETKDIGRVQALGMEVAQPEALPVSP